MNFILIFFLVFISNSLVFAKVTTKQISKAVKINLKRVPEFKFIQEEADKLGVKVYLFGGTASAFAHYVRWDLEREAGDTKYQKERFDYDFTNIYRGNQDLDIVVDGTAEQAAQLEQVLKKKYPHFVGNKEAWEIRLLRAQTGDKLPLLNNYDFLNQHTDTNSTGMLAVNPTEGEIVFRDLFSWEDSESQFLKDVSSGEIKFLFSDQHGKTSRAKEGKNPPVFAAIRYLAKLAQYEVIGIPEDLNTIKKIITETNWRIVKDNFYVRHKLEEFGKKVLLNAPDSEYAWNLLAETGLRRKLIEMDGNKTQEVNSLSWWMNKEPLRSKEVGQGSGRNALTIFKEKGIDELIISHETTSFTAYENITRSSKGRANAFISRGSTAGEMANFGDGFYTRMGEKGATGSGITIRFKISPTAKEGSDFLYHLDYLVILNKNAISLIQENLDITLLDFYKLILKGDIGPNDKGLITKIQRKFKRNNNQLVTGEVDKVANFIRSQLSKQPTPQRALLFEMWFNLKISKKYEDIFIYAIEKAPLRIEYLKALLDIRQWSRRPELIDLILKYAKTRKTSKLLVEKILQINFNKWSKHPQIQLIIDTLVEAGHADKDLVDFLHTPHFKKSVNPFAKNLDQNYKNLKLISIRGSAHSKVVSLIMSEPWIDHPQVFDLIESLIDNTRNNSKAYYSLIFFVFSKDKLILKNRTRMHALLKKLINHKKSTPLFIERVFSNSAWKWTKDKSAASLLIEVMSNTRFGYQAIRYILSNKDWWNNKDFLKIMKIAVSKPGSAAHLLYHSEVYELANHPKVKEIIQILLERVDQKTFRETFFSILKRIDWRKNPWITLAIDKIIHQNRKTVSSTLIYQVLSTEEWGQHPESEKWIKTLITNNKNTQDVIIHLLTKEHWYKRTSFLYHLGEILDKNPKENTITNILGTYLFRSGILKDHLQLTEYLEGASLSYEELISKEVSLSRWLKFQGNGLYQCTSFL